MFPTVEVAADKAVVVFPAPPPAVPFAPINFKNLLPPPFRYVLLLILSVLWLAHLAF